MRLLFYLLGAMFQAACICVVGLADENHRDTSETAIKDAVSTSEPRRTVSQATIDHVLNGRFEAALPAYRRNVESDPNNPDLRVDLAGILGMAGHHDESVKELREAVRLGPSNARAHGTLGLILVESGNFQEGLDKLRAAVQFQPNKAERLTDLAAGLAMAGQWEEAIKELQCAIRLEPNYHDAYINLGGIYSQLGRYADAIQALSASLAIEETQRARIGRALAFRRNRQFIAAVEDCDRVLCDDPDNDQALACRAYSNMRRGEFEAAVQDAERILATGEDFAWIAHLVLGSISATRQEQQEWGSAIEHLNQAIELVPDDPTPYVMRAAVRFQRVELDQVIPDLDAAIQVAGGPRRLNYHLDGFGWQVYKFRGMMHLYFTKGGGQTAVKDLTEAIALNGFDADCYALRAQAFWKLADWEHALADLHKALAIVPGHDLATYSLIEVLTSCTDDDIRDGHRAMSLAAEACERTNWRSPTYLRLLAAAYSEMGDFTNAILVQTKLVEMPATQKQADTYPLDIWWNSKFTLHFGVPEQGAAERLKLYQQRKPYRLSKDAGSLSPK